mmetsp:Transcript_10372/g.15967  ORF Transcript_10372/g.15967 Transcript_10372/m.15967 type:complete len:153 (+) Transcript_10372:664-1122(+)
MQLANYLNGDILIDSEPDKGTTVKILIMPEIFDDNLFHKSVSRAGSAREIGSHKVERASLLSRPRSFKSIYSQYKSVVQGSQRTFFSSPICRDQDSDFKKILYIQKKQRRKSYQTGGNNYSPFFGDYKRTRKMTEVIKRRRPTQIEEPKILP